MNIIECNVETGEQTVREMTEDEVAALQITPVFPVPASVTMRQARLALLQKGMLDQVDSAISALPGDDGKAARIEWEFSSAVERYRPLVATLGDALGLSGDQLDDLFRLAATL